MGEKLYLLSIYVFTLGYYCRKKTKTNSKKGEMVFA